MQGNESDYHYCVVQGPAEGQSRAGRTVRHVATAGAVVGVAAAVALAVGLWWPSAWSGGPAGAAGRIVAVGAENQYADVIAQVGGRYVQVWAIIDNPNTDPHTFEASPSVAQEVARARLVVQNGLGYDSFMGRIEAASPDRSRRVLTVQHLLGLPDSTPNPHLWYRPSTMPVVAAAVARALGSVEPARRAYFTARARAFDASLRPWHAAIARFRRRYAGTTAAVTEPVADNLLRAMGVRIRTPFTMQADVMNGVDPSPEDIGLEEQLLSGRRVRVFVYNRQVVDPLTQSFLADARAAHVPVVGVYETMPAGYHYQRWMEAEVRAVRLAVSRGVSTRGL